MVNTSQKLNTSMFLLALLFSGLFSVNKVYAEEILFSDNFSRANSDSLGSPSIGGAWIEANESSATDVSTDSVRKTYIQLSNEKFDIVYDTGTPFVPARHVYAYASLSRVASLDATTSFNFIPHETARMHHEIALMDSVKSYNETFDGVGQPLYLPVDGVGIFIARSSIDYTNSQVYFVSYRNGVRTVYFPSNRLLPFQFMPGVSYNVDFAINSNGLLTAKISNDSQTISVTSQVPSSEIAGLNLNQISVTDSQGGAFTSNIHHTYFDNFIVVSKTATVPPIENRFPLYTQTVSAYPSIAETTSWASVPLAGGTAGVYCPTIGACGCAITSTVMLARSYGVTTGIDGTDVNPKNFNDWLTTHNGYKGAGDLDFSQGMKYFGIEENGVQKSYFKWKDKPLSDSAVRQRVTSGVPVVSLMSAKRNRNSEERGPHFVLVTEPLGVGQYGVNDPIWFNTKNLDDDVNRASMVQDYSDHITNGRDLTFSPTPVVVANAFSSSLIGQGSGTLTNSAFVRITALLASAGQSESGTAPAEMFMSTPGGGRLGYDPRGGQSFTLANGYYGNEAFLSDPLDENTPPVTDVLKTLSVSELSTGLHKVYVVGTGTGTYKYAGLVHDSSGHEHPFTFTTETANGMVDVYQFDITTGEVKLLPIDTTLFKGVIDGEIKDATLNRFFTMWAEKIMGEIKDGKMTQAREHIETFKTLMKAKKVDSPALNLLLKKLVVQVG